MAKSGKISNSLVSLSSAAILAIYAAGYEHTLPATAAFAVHPGPRAASAVPKVAAIVRPADAAQLPVAVPGVRSAPMRREPTPARENAPSPVLSETPATPSEAPAPAAQPQVESAAAPADEPAQPQVYYRDGTYTGWGYSRHGDIQATVVVQGGRILSASIAQCLTQYSCNWIEDLPPQVVTIQSAEVDIVTGATQSSDAFYGAVLEALNKAK